MRKSLGRLVYCFLDRRLLNQWLFEELEKLFIEIEKNYDVTDSETEHI